MSADPLIVVAIFFLILFFAALITGLLLQRRRSVREAGGKPATDKSTADWIQSIAAPPGSGGERMASPISEAIEDAVRAGIAADPSLKARRIDFGTSPDGGLEIWVDEERFLDVAAIRDERIRTLIQETVEAYNQGKL